MRITVNGEQREFNEPMVVDALLAHLSIIPRKIAVEHNRRIVPKSSYSTTPVRDGDEIEIVQFVGGG